MADEPKGRLIQIDENAGSADSSLSAFIARPEGAPVYHGLLILDEVEVDGFKLGMIAGFGGEWSSDDGMDGDAFVWWLRTTADAGWCGMLAALLHSRKSALRMRIGGEFGASALSGL